MTINEFGSYIDGGYASAGARRAEVLPPRWRRYPHNAVLAHGLAVQAIRAAATHPVQVGLAQTCPAPCPPLKTTQHIHAAEIALREITRPTPPSSSKAATPTLICKPSVRTPRNLRPKS